MSYFAHPETRWGYPSYDKKEPYVPTPRARRVMNMLRKLYRHIDEMGTFERGMVESLRLTDAQYLGEISPKMMRRIGLMFIKYCWKKKP